MKKQKIQIQDKEIKNINVVHIKFTLEELEEFEKLMSIKNVKATTLAKQLFMKNFQEFLEKNKFGVFVPYTENKGNRFLKTLQFRVDENTANELDLLNNCTGLTRITVARMMILPAVKEEIEKYEESK